MSILNRQTFSRNAITHSLLLDRLLESSVAFRPLFADLTGSAAAGLFLSQLYYWTKVINRENPDRRGWLYKTAMEWQSEIKLSTREQGTARKRLKSLGLLEEKLCGLPATTWYRINLPELYRQLLAILAAPEEPPSKTPFPKPAMDAVPEWIKDTEDFREILHEIGLAAHVSSQIGENAKLDTANRKTSIDKSLALHTEITTKTTYAAASVNGQARHDSTDSGSQTIHADIPVDQNSNQVKPLGSSDNPKVVQDSGHSTVNHWSARIEYIGIQPSSGENDQTLTKAFMNGFAQSTTEPACQYPTGQNEADSETSGCPEPVEDAHSEEPTGTQPPKPNEHPPVQPIPETAETVAVIEATPADQLAIEVSDIAKPEAVCEAGASEDQELAPMLEADKPRGKQHSRGSRNTKKVRNSKKNRTGKTPPQRKLACEQQEIHKTQAQSITRTAPTVNPTGTNVVHPMTTVPESKEPVPPITSPPTESWFNRTGRIEWNPNQPDFDFDRCLGWLWSQLLSSDLPLDPNDTLDRVHVRDNLEHFFDTAYRFSAGNALEWVYSGQQQRLERALRTAKVAYERAHRSDALTGYLKAQAEAFESKARNVERPRAICEKLTDRSWADGVDFNDANLL